MRCPLVVWSMMCSSFVWTQESVPALRGSSDAGQRVFEQRIARPVPGQDTTVMDVADVATAPTFPGGETALFERLASAPSCLPENDHDCIRTSEVEVSFVVERNGKVTRPHIENGGCPALERYALCAVLGLPAFTAGLYNDRTVRTRMRIPLRYAQQ